MSAWVPRRPLGLDWPALVLAMPGGHQFRGDVQLPGSKSLTNRMLLLAAAQSALQAAPVTLTYSGDSDDSLVFRRFLRAIGVQVDEHPTAWTIQSPADLFQRPLGEVAVDLGLAGTALRFITAFACTLNGTFVLDGAPRLRERPVGALVDSLVAAGADVRALAQPGCLPLRIVGQPGWQPAQLTVDPSASSQLLSALLLLAPRLQPGTRIVQSGPASTESYVQMTLGLLQRLGWTWETSPGGYVLAASSPQANGPLTWPVEADWSAASYWLAWLSLGQGSLLLPQLSTRSLQGDAGQVDWLRTWGLELADTPGGLQVSHVPGRTRIQPLTADFTATPDLAQTYAVLCATVAGRSHFTGLHTLPAKETDRLAAVVAELAAVGIHAEATPDRLTVHGRPEGLRQLRAIRTYHDHRMAMAFSLLAARMPQVRIEAPGVVAKSYPMYWEHLVAQGMVLERPDPNAEM